MKKKKKLKADCGKCLWLGMYCIARECHYEPRNKRELMVHIPEMKPLGDIGKARCL